MKLFKSNFFVFASKNIFIFSFLLISIFSCSLADAKNGEKIGILYSYKNVDAYRNNDIVGFHEVWKSFIETFEETYLDYQFLCNISQETKVEDLGVNVIYFPLAVDIDEDEKNFLNSFIKSGGKLIVSAGIGPISDNVKNLLSENNITVKENVIAKQSLNLKPAPKDIHLELPVGNFYSIFELSGPTRKTLAIWKENNQIAIGGTKNLVYLGYSWGQNIDKTNDIKALHKTLDFFWNELSSSLTKEITKKEYEKTAKEINTLREEASLVIQIADQLDLPVPKLQLNKHFADGDDLLKDFNSNYLFGDYFVARENANLAKSAFAIVYSLGVPIRKVEIRAIWLDRGTIVGTKNPNELRKLIKNIARTGFNVIFFETINAGYPIYPSKLLPQNPLVKDWDPLKIAIEAAHTYGIELHAWVWTFAVGNTKHNLLIEKPIQYPGPIISTKGRSWALASIDGQLRIEMQPETWLSPANHKATDFLKELFTEIVTNYDIDGFQFDYIRFPFQKRYSQVGFDFITKNAFHEATGMLPTLEGAVNKIWREWKVKLVSDFVKDTSSKLKQIKPNLKISAAVFAIDRSLRLQLIQQDWESWLINRWVDAVYPFYYSFTQEEVKTKLALSKKITNDQGIIIPGFNLRVLSVGELAERVRAARNAGVLGLALFAEEHLNNEKRELLKSGPFREQTAFIPYNKPYIGCQKLLDDFSSIVERFTLSHTYSILSDSQTQKEVYYLTKELKNDFQNYTPDKINEIEKRLVNLQLKVKGWLSLEKYLNREQRVLYIYSYLDQIKTLLNYMRTENFNYTPEN